MDNGLGIHLINLCLGAPAGPSPTPATATDTIQQGVLISIGHGVQDAARRSSALPDRSSNSHFAERVVVRSTSRNAGIGGTA